MPRSSPNKLVSVQSLYYEMYDKTFSKKKVYETFDHSRRCLAVKKNLEGINLHSSKFNTVEIFQVSNHFRKDTCNS